MIQIIGLIVAVYAIARLLQVPIESSVMGKKDVLLWLISLAAIMGIGGLTLMLLVSSVPALTNLK